MLTKINDKLYKISVSLANAALNKYKN